MIASMVWGAGLLGCAGCETVDQALGAAMAWLDDDAAQQAGDEATTAAATATASTGTSGNTPQANKPTTTARGKDSNVVPLPVIDASAVRVVGKAPVADAPLLAQLARLRQLAGVGEVRALGALLSWRTRDRLDPAARGLVPIAPRTLWQRISGPVTSIRYDGGRAIVSLGGDDRRALTFYLEDGSWRLDLLADDRAALEARSDAAPANLPTLRDATAGIRGTGPLVAIISTTLGQVLCELDEAHMPGPVAAFVALARGKITSLREAPDGTAFWVEQRYFDGGANERSRPGAYAALRGRSRTHGSGLRIPDQLELGARFDRAGVLALNNEGPDTADGDFVITLAAVPSFDDKLTRIGRCDDLDVVAKIAAAAAGAVTIEDVVVQRGR